MEYIVYVGTCDGLVVYVGSGKRGRENHLNSGVSHCYHANKAHFEGSLIQVEIVYSCSSKEESLEYERGLIRELNPLWNVVGSKGREEQKVLEDVVRENVNKYGNVPIDILLYHWAMGFMDDKLESSIDLKPLYHTFDKRIVVAASLRKGRLLADYPKVVESPRGQRVRKFKFLEDRIKKGVVSRYSMECRKKRPDQCVVVPDGYTLAKFSY